MTTTQSTTRFSSHPLKDVVNTNDDPTRCANCLVDFDWFDCDDLAPCCGKAFCDACTDQNVRFLRSAARGQQVHCGLCRAPVSTNSPKEYVSRLKKHAKKGKPWAQFELSCAYSREESIFECKRWSEKAAKLNHPGAIYRIGTMHLNGDFGFDIDLSKARGIFDDLLSHSWASSSSFFAESCQLGLVAIGQRYIERATANEDPRGLMTAIAILDPIATGERAKKRDIFDAQYQLGRAHGETGNMALARAWCMSSFFCKMADPTCSAITSAPAIGARIACGRLRMWAQVKFWNEIAKNLPIPTGLCNGERRNRVESLVWHCQYLRKLRDSCGGCGALFEGKQRKFCRGCRTYCYCGRACQKNHWNRKEKSHREDCKAAMELKQKLKEVRMGDAAMKNDK